MYRYESEEEKRKNMDIDEHRVIEAGGRFGSDFDDISVDDDEMVNNPKRDMRMSKMYDIDKIRCIQFGYMRYGDVDGCYENNVFVKQIFYYDNGTLTDIFKDTYIPGIYENGEMPVFHYDSNNRLYPRDLTDIERQSGKISEERLLEIYCKFNSKYIDYSMIDAMDSGKITTFGINRFGRR